MKLILAEKPSVAKTIASFLGAKTKRDGYFEGNGYIVTYAVGHLVSLYDVKDYDKSYAGSWKSENFPLSLINLDSKLTGLNLSNLI